MLVIALAGAAALAIVAATDERTLAFNPGARVVAPMVAVAPGEEVCQRGLEAAARFDVVALRLGTGTTPGPPLAASVRATGSGRVLARGTVAAGARDNREVSARLAPPVAEGSAIDVCFRDAGARDVAFYGSPTYESPGHSFVGSRPGGGDIRIVFRRSRPRSALSLVPDMFERASLFRPAPVGAWTFWALLAAVAAGIPLLLAGALRRATRT
ncbi:MAG: hypothetical protein QOE06_1550 [Thermoleophilaceae bacterium]|nr:hypothetical protein [Thermoleophilaceae bacterium]